LLWPTGCWIYSPCDPVSNSPQAADVPLKTVDCLRDLPAMMRAVTATDLNDAFALFGTNDDEIFTAIGTAGPQPPATPPALKMQTELPAPAPESKDSSDGDGRAMSDMLMSALAKALTTQLGAAAGAGVAAQDAAGNGSARHADSGSAAGGGAGDSSSVTGG
jgi:hypothetical protein